MSKASISVGYQKNGTTKRIRYIAKGLKVNMSIKELNSVDELEIRFRDSVPEEMRKQVLEMWRHKKVKVIQ